MPKTDYEEVQALPRVALPVGQRPYSVEEVVLGIGAVPRGFRTNGLAPPVSTQIRFACVQAQEAAFRLQGLPFPASIVDLPDQGRGASENLGLIADAHARIGDTIAMLEALPANALSLDSDSRIVHELPNGMVFD